jgi:hypothetical protein
MPALIAIAFVLGLVAGWLAHRRLSLHYKQRWLAAVHALEDKQLETADLALVGAGPATAGAAPSSPAAAIPPRVQPVDATPYVAGKWALDERHEGDSAVYYAVRRGFEPVKLGQTANYRRFGALYRRDRENAQGAVHDMNTK